MPVPVILAGGVGSRLWPQSRALMPKQFVQFPGQTSTLFQDTLVRLNGLDDLDPPVVICNEDHRFLIAEQLRQLGISGSTILLEPVGRSTAPAVALAALAAMQAGDDPVLLVLPADHEIGDPEALHIAIRHGEQAALEGSLVTFGIVPGAPETGFGYIKATPSLPGTPVRPVERFVEKPDLPTATAYLESGDYLWNSGMFMFRCSVLLEELQRQEPQMLEYCRESFAAAEADLDFLRIPAEPFSSCPANSIDYAIMEKTERAVAVPLDARWNDLGAWSAIWEVADKDEQGNAVSGDVLLAEVSNSYVQADSRLVAAVGVSDTIVVETADAVLVADRNRVQGVKQIVEMLEQLQRSESQHHRQVFRPWGSYRSLEVGEGFQVKHIIVNPGQSLSLQMHQHRAEHWMVVSGEAQVTRDDEVHQLVAGDSILLPLGCRHRLQNMAEEPVSLIEVQLGGYLGEDDIIRFDDVYGRVKKP